MSTQPKHRYAADEYLELDRAAEVRSEFVDGEIYGMAGASARHVQIVGNLVRGLGNRLLERPCVVYSSDLRVCVDRKRMYAYPDVAVVCEEPQFLDVEMDTLLNPVLIIEVLSESTKNYDRGEKFLRYRSLPSFREYILVAQDRVYVEHLLKQDDGTWVFSETGDPSGVVEIASVGCRIPLSEIYLKVPIPPASETPGAGENNR